jgi:hypothetical protein
MTATAWRVWRWAIRTRLPPPIGTFGPVAPPACLGGQQRPCARTARGLQRRSGVASRMGSRTSSTSDALVLEDLPDVTYRRQVAPAVRTRRGLRRGRLPRFGPACCGPRRRRSAARPLCCRCQDRSGCPALLGRPGPSRAGPSRPSRNPDPIAIANSPKAPASRCLCAAPIAKSLRLRRTFSTKA